MKRFLMRWVFGGTNQPTWAAEVGLTALRVFAGLTLALAHGRLKLPGAQYHSIFIEGVGKLGFPAPTLFAWAAILAEFLGGICLALGLGTRVAAFFVAFTMATAAFGQHGSDPFSKKEMALLFLSIAVAFMLKGAGRISADALIRRTWGVGR